MTPSGEDIKEMVGELFWDWRWLLHLASEEENGGTNERQQRSRPRWQKGHCLTFRQSTWEWHVQVRHEAARIQEDVPERRLGEWNTIVELTPPTVSANPHIIMGRVYKLWGPWVLLFLGYTSSSYWWFLFGGLGALPLSTRWQAWVLSVAGNCYLSRTPAIFCHWLNGPFDQSFQIAEALQAIQ